MRVWVIQDGEPIPGIDENARDWRAAMLSRALVAKGHEVLWWASTFNHAQKRHRFDSPRTIQLRSRLQVHLLHGPGYSHNKSLRRFFHQRVLAKAFAHKAVSHSKPDIVFCSLPTLEFAEQSVRYGRKVEVPVLVDVRDLWPDIYLMAFPAWLRGIARLGLVSEFRRARRICQSATGITAVSESYMGWALNCAGRSKRDTDGIFPLGYPLPAKNLKNEELAVKLRTQYDLQPEMLVVTFIGTFGTSYDLETVIQAARILELEGVSNVRIVLAGDGDKKSRLQQMAQGLHNVVFTGWLDQSAIMGLMQISSIGLVAYIDQALQSLPNKFFEYIAAGLPVLSSLRGELESLIRDEQVGFQYQAGDADSLVEKIRLLAANPETVKEMSQRARRLFKERFSAEIVYPQLAQHLEHVVREYRTAKN